MSTAIQTDTVATLLRNEYPILQRAVRAEISTQYQLDDESAKGNAIAPGPEKVACMRVILPHHAHF